MQKLDRALTLSEGGSPGWAMGKTLVFLKQETFDNLSDVRFVLRRNVAKKVSRLRILRKLMAKQPSKQK